MVTSPEHPSILLAVEVDGPLRKWVRKLLIERPALTEAVSKCNRAAIAGQLRALVPRREEVSPLPTKREWRVSPLGFGTHEPVRGASLQEKQGRAKRRNDMMVDPSGQKEETAMMNDDLVMRSKDIHWPDGFSPGGADLLAHN